MQFGPAPVPYFFIISYASSRSDTSIPKASHPFWLPERLWNISPVGAPASTAFICVVTCPRTHCCAGIFHLSMNSWKVRRSRPTLSGSSMHGLSPMTASPHPYDSPSIRDARTPVTSSTGWFG